MKLEIVLADITKIKVDAIVNAANASLLRGGGVDGAIHKACGGNLERECMELDGCLVGQAKITRAYDLHKNGVSWIIHAVGPRWFGGLKNEHQQLKNAYKSSLELATSYKENYIRQCLEVSKKYSIKMSEDEKHLFEIRVIEDAKKYAENNAIRSIAFPAISTGIYRFPLEQATSIALDEIDKFKLENQGIEIIKIVCFDEKTYNCYLNLNN